MPDAIGQRDEIERMDPVRFGLNFPGSRIQTRCRPRCFDLATRASGGVISRSSLAGDAR